MYAKLGIELVVTKKTAVLSLLFLECNFLEISVICLENFAKIYDWPTCLF